MKVKDLMAELSKLDPSLDVICYTEEESLLKPGHSHRLFDIDHVDTVVAERCRDDMRMPSLKFGKDSRSEALAILNVVGDF